MMRQKGGLNAHSPLYNVLHPYLIANICFITETKTRGKYLFAIPYLPTQERPQLAELRFNQLHHAQTYRKVTLIVKRNGLHRKKSFKKTLGYSKAGVLDITNITVPFLLKFHGNLTLKIKVQYKNPYRVDKVNSEISDPILVIYSQDKDFLKTFYSSYSSLTSQREETVSNSRTKRSSEGKKTGRKRKKNKWKPNEICKLHKFKVDFDLIGWGPWIVHPKKFNAKVCFGQCPAPVTHEYTPTNHAMLQTLMRMKRPLSAPEPCCVPTKLRPLSMLYYEYDDVVVRHHQDMIATECGCRWRKWAIFRQGVTE